MIWPSLSPCIIISPILLKMAYMFSAHVWGRAWIWRCSLLWSEGSHCISCFKSLISYNEVLPLLIMTNTKLKLSKLLDLFSAELYWWLYCKQAVTLAVMSNIFDVKCNLYIQWLAFLEVDCAGDIFIYFISGIWPFKTFSYLPNFLNSCMNFCHK